MRAGGRGIFDDGHLGGAFVGAECHVAQRGGLQQLRRVHGLGRLFRKGRGHGEPCKGGSGEQKGEECEEQAVEGSVVHGRISS